MPPYDALDRPRFIAADHVSWTVPDLEAAVRFYVDVFGARELYRLGPFDADEMPREADGRDWMENHVGVRGARLTLAMLRLIDNLNFQLVQYDKPGDPGSKPPQNHQRGGHHLAIRVDDVLEAGRYLAAHGCTVLSPIVMDAGPLAGKTNLYVLDPWGHQLEIVD